MSKKHDISDTDKALFREAMRGVKRLVMPKKIIPQPPRLAPLPKKQKTAEEPSFAPFSDYERLDPVSSDELIEFQQPGLQHKILRKLRRGQYNVEIILDLHGMTAAEAKESLHHFLLRCQKMETRCVLIIHGKGRNSSKPILKNKLNNWLRQLENVLAFCSAIAKDGHSGALYVLLKNQKGETIR